MSSYVQARKQSAERLKEERNSANRIYEQTKERLEEGFREFLSMQGYLGKREELILWANESTEIKRRLSRGDKSDLISAAEYVGLLDIFLENADDPKCVRKVRKALEKDLERCNRKLDLIISSFSNSLEGLKRGIIQSTFRGYADGKEVLEKLDALAQVSYAEEFREISKVLEGMDSREANEFRESFEAYKKSVDSFTPKISKEKLKQIAKNNANALEDEIREEERRKNAYFNSLEGRVLSYATHSIDLKEEISKIDKDEEHISFLEDKADESLSFVEENQDAINNSIESLLDQGYISEKESDFLRQNLEKKFGKKDKKEPEDSLEDINLRALVLQEDYGVGPEESVRIAKLIRDGDMTRAPYGLSALGSNLGKILIRENPELLFLDDAQLQKYTSLVGILTGECNKYADIKDLDILQNPQGFASFEALRETRRKLRGLERYAPQEPQTEKERILDKLEPLAEDSGLEAEKIFNILNWGFWFNGIHFIGSHKIKLDTLEANVSKHAEIEERNFNRTLRWLINNKVINSERGYSITSHIKEIRNQALRELVGYVLSRHPTED